LRTVIRLRRYKSDRGIMRSEELTLLCPTVLPCVAAEQRQAAIWIAARRSRKGWVDLGQVANWKKLVLLAAVMRGATAVDP
jgi:hypothetical protein